MNSFLAGNAMALLVPLVDASGNKISVTSIEYRIVDENDVELVAKAPLADFVADSDDAAIAVPVEVNTLAAGQLRAARVIELYCLVGGATLLLRHLYAIESASTLVIGDNSFQTYAQAELLALDMPDLIGWVNATEASRIAALIESSKRICQLRFANINDFSQGTLNGMDTLSVENYLALPKHFRTCLCHAQVAEANALLGGDSTDAKRREGLIMDRVGESTQQYLPVKPLELPVCKRALRYLSGYVQLSGRLGRG